MLIDCSLVFPIFISYIKKIYQHFKIHATKTGQNVSQNQQLNTHKTYLVTANNLCYCETLVLWRYA